MIPIIKFEHKSKLYCVELQNKELKYYYIKNNIKNYNLTPEERTLIDFVVDSVTPSNEIIRLFNYRLNGNNYEVYLDRKTNLRLFKPTPNYEDAMILNRIFNDMKEYVALENKSNNNSQSNENTSYIKRIITKYGRIIIAFVLTGLALNSIAQINEPSLPSELSDIEGASTTAEYSAYQKIEYTRKLSNEEFISRIIIAINSNPNLSDKEKEEFLSLQEMYLENKQYMDIEYLENVLSKISIEYRSEHNPTMAGCYNNVTNCITIYEARSIDEVIPSTLSHEIMHAQTKYYSPGYNSFLNETTNVLFNDDYRYYDNSLYRQYLRFDYALMKLIGTEPFQQYHNYTDTNFLVTPLCKIIDEEEKAIKLLGMLDDYKKMTEQIKYKKIDEKEGKQNLKQLEELIKQQLIEYYKAKYNASIDTNPVMLCFIEPEKFNKTAIELAFSKEISEEGIEEYEVECYPLIRCFGRAKEQIKIVHVTVKHGDEVQTITFNYDTGEIVHKSQLSKYPRLYNSIIGKLVEEMCGIASYNTSDRTNNNYINALIELIGIDPMIKYLNTGNVEYLIDALSQIIDDPEKALEFINNIEEYKRTYNDSYCNDTRTEETVMRMFELQDKIPLTFNDYYYAKSGRTIDSDWIMLRNVDEQRFENEYIVTKLEQFGIDTVSDARKEYRISSYASNYYYNVRQNLLVTIIDRSGKTEFEETFDDSNRYTYVLDLSNTPTH